VGPVKLDKCWHIELLIAREDLEGCINVSAPHPVPNREFMQILQCAAGVRLGLPATKWMLELGAFFLRTETELILKSRRVLPSRLLHAGFSFAFPIGLLPRRILFAPDVLFIRPWTCPISILVSRLALDMACLGD
jgi:hypothetical protein